MHPVTEKDPVSPRVHPTNFYNIQCLPLFILIDFTKSMFACVHPTYFMYEF